MFKMKVTYYLPAHPSYFTEDLYTQEEVDKAISMFQFLFKPGKLGEIPETFVFLTQPGKDVMSRFDSTDMKSPEAVTKERWLKHTPEFAGDELKKHVKQINELLAGGRKLKAKGRA
jgi:hypothetical protein